MLPKNREPTHPGKILLKEFMVPLGLTQKVLASELKIPIGRLNEIINGRRGITANTAIRLSRRFKTSPEIWMGLQADVDLWRELRRPSAQP